MRLRLLILFVIGEIATTVIAAKAPGRYGKKKNGYYGNHNTGLSHYKKHFNLPLYLYANFGIMLRRKT
jgi:hypothetical protein